MTILTDHGFAARWRMPRLAALGTILPGVEVQIATMQAEIDAADADFDVAIMFGAGDWSGFRATPLFREEVYPVCSPGYAGDRTMPLEAGAIAALRLLHLRGRSDGRWFGWRDWFAAHGIAADPSTQEPAFDNVQLLLPAALLGQGMALGWVPPIDGLVAAGGLVRLAAEPLRSMRGYHLFEHLDRPFATTLTSFRQWLLDTATTGSARFEEPAAPLPSHGACHAHAAIA